VPPDLHPDAPNPVALQRRVLLAAAATLLSFVGIGYVLTALEAPPWLLLPALLIVLVVVVRPLMAPVLAASRLRRRLAYQAFLDSKDDERG
jgi:ABC-type iron transport system FetAB permease component